MLLENKNAIIYGAGGSIGVGVAKEFARERAGAITGTFVNVTSGMFPS